MPHDVCETVYTDQKAVDYVAKRLSDARQTNKIAEIFRTLADPTRIHIIEALSIRELCVCDLAHLLGLTQSATSHQLRLLRQSGIVRYRKEGRVVYYTLDDAHVADVLKAVADHAAHKETE